MCKHGVMFLILKWSQWNSFFAGEEKKTVCEVKLEHGDCYNALQTFRTENKHLETTSLACVWKFVGWKSKLCLWVRRAFKFTETGGYNFSWNERKRQKANKELASNILAKRLENVLPEIIHFDQSVFVKGRTIFDAIRTIDDVIEHTMNRDILGSLAAIDFEKALDVSGKGI